MKPEKQFQLSGKHHLLITINLISPELFDGSAVMVIALILAVLLDILQCWTSVRNSNHDMEGQTRHSDPRLNSN